MLKTLKLITLLAVIGAAVSYFGHTVISFTLFALAKLVPYSQSMPWPRTYKQPVFIFLDLLSGAIVGGLTGALLPRQFLNNLTLGVFLPRWGLIAGATAGILNTVLLATFHYIFIILESPSNLSISFFQVVPISIVAFGVPAAMFGAVIGMLLQNILPRFLRHFCTGSESS